MHIEEVTVGHENVLPAPVVIGLADLDQNGCIIAGDEAFYLALRHAKAVGETDNLLQFLEREATFLGSTMVSGAEGKDIERSLYRLSIETEITWKRKVFDFAIVPVTAQGEGHYSVMVSDITDMIKKEYVLDLLVNLSHTILASPDMTNLIKDIRKGLGRIMDTTNFFIALYDEENDALTFPFFDDVQDHFEMVPARGTLSAYVINKGNSVLFREGDFRSLEKDGHIGLVGTDSKVWLGAPLCADGNVFGVIGLQSYEEPEAYNETDKEILDLVASQIGLAINKIRNQQDIQVGKTYFERLFHYAPLPIVIQQYPGVISDVNNAFEQLFGFTASEVVGQSIDDVIVPEENLAEGQQITYDAFKGDLIETEVVRKKKNGQLIDVALKAKMFQISPGEKVVYAIYQDISQNKEYERQLVEAKEKAEEADRLKSAFLTNMSHEIRTPMNAILGFSQLLAATAMQKENREEYTRIILESGENLLHLIDDILDLAKIEAGQMTIRKESVDVNELMGSLQMTFLELNEKKLHKDIEITLNLPDQETPFTLYTDPLRLRQILTNLIGNAIKFTPFGSIEIGYSLVNNKKEVEFFVRDTGIGISKDKLQLIFDRFQQVDNSRTRQYSGTGLGLAISKKLTNLLGGEIRVKSREGKGSTFSFTLPYEKIESTKTKAEQYKAVVDYPDLTQYKVMIAEDDEINFLFMREILKKTGAQLIRASNGNEVLDYIHENQEVDLILMDMEMPEMNGYEATKQVKKEYPEIVVVAQTAYVSPEEKHKCLEVGCDEYLSKPIQMNKLFSVIRQQLKMHE